jgi:processive 1,2-diacylglycerol beta-glucosyltransferase
LGATGRCTTRLVDAYLDYGRGPLTRFPGIYAELARNHPRLWSMVYRAAVRPLDPSWILGPFLRSGLQQMIEREQPHVVISVLPAVNGLVAHALRGAPAPLEVVLTDWHAVHPYWVARGVHHYTVPTESARADCIRNGAAPAAIDVVGIPVRREFAQPHRSAHRPEGFRILVMMGAEGSPRALRNLAALARSNLDAQLVVVCGHNSDLRQRIERLRAYMPMQALGFVEDVAGLMRSADMLVTKAGGVTLAEAFCCGIPVLIHDVLPGQESGNLEYALAHGAVAYAPSTAQLVTTVRRLKTDTRWRADLAQCAARLARPAAAQQIAANVLRRLDASSA